MWGVDCCQQRFDPIHVSPFSTLHGPRLSDTLCGPNGSPGFAREVIAMRRARRSLLWLCLVLPLATGAAADDFRIQTDVYAGKSKIPVSQNTTLFRAGYVYDYMINPQRADAVEHVAVFDQPHGRFIVMDPARKLKAEVKTDDVLLFASKLQAAVSAKSSNAFTKFAVDPEFEIDFSQDGQLTLASAHMTYHLKTMPANTPEAAMQFREFSDWYGRFNNMANPGSTPPFARMAVNTELAKRGLVPTEVQLTIPAQTGVKAASLRSEHHVSWRLLARDIEKIEATANQLSAFKQVDFDQFERTSLTKR
jgi:hypothetical protein